MANRGFQIIEIRFEFNQKATLVEATLVLHDTGEIVGKMKEFDPTISASEILRMHMDYPDEWIDTYKEPLDQG